MAKVTRTIILYTLFCICFFTAVLWINRSVTVISENFPIERKHTIIIDAGHGGIDGGAISCTGKPESSYNLEISLILNDLLNFMGFQTVMIRTTDISVYTKGESISQKKISDLKERVRMVNEVENGVLLSIHQNKFPDSRYSGAQVFYSKTEGSQELADAMQSGFIITLNPGSRRATKKADGVYLMEHINCTGVLVECGFLSNPAEEARLCEKSYQQKVCCVIAASLSCCLSNT